MTIKDITTALRNAAIEEAERETEEILCHVLGVDRTTLYLRGLDNIEVPEEKKRLLDEILTRRMRREPLQYILGEVEFYGLRLKVGRGVLIPRPETELLVETVLSFVEKGVPANFTALDLCTGSGCIALAIAKTYPHWSVAGIDISRDALAYAIANRDENHLINVSFFEGRLFESLTGNSSFDIIVSNPPYIPKGDIKTLQPEIRLYEPMEALDGGRDGLSFYRRIIGPARRYLNPGGKLFLEIGAGQGVKIKEIALAAGFETVLLKKDYANKERIAIID